MTNLKRLLIGVVWMLAVYCIVMLASFHGRAGEVLFFTLWFGFVVFAWYQMRYRGLAEKQYEWAEKNARWTVPHSRDTYVLIYKSIVWVLFAAGLIVYPLVISGLVD